jgi:AraC-like DNA-binding protein
VVEATAPIYDRGLIIGYFMFGQLTDRQDRQVLVREFCKKFARLNVDLPDPNTDEAANSIQYRSLAEIRAAAKILEALTSYVLLHHLVTVRHERLVNQIDQYISEHVSGPIAAADLCRALGIGRTRLYELTRQYLGMGWRPMSPSSEWTRPPAAIWNEPDHRAGRGPDWLRRLHLFQQGIP